MVEIIEETLDKMLKMVLNATVPHDVLRYHIKAGQSVDGTKGIEILRTMQKAYTDVNGHDLSSIYKKLVDWRIHKIAEDPQRSINGWKQLYNILKKVWQNY